MDATRGRQRLNFSLPFAAMLGGDSGRRVAFPVATTFALALAGLAGLMFLVMPTGVLEDLAVDSGVASLITAAQPPLGLTARLAIAFIVALAVGGVSWFGLFLLVGNRSVVIRRGKREDGVPVLRRADAHPDAPARRPVFAHRDLGTPFLEVKAEPMPEPQSFDDAMTFEATPFERDIPKDLDTPLATYLHPLDPPLPTPEPVATPDPEPLPILRTPDPVAPPPIAPEWPVPEPVVAVDPRPAPEPMVEPQQPEPRFAPHERIETFELTPMVRPSAGEPNAPLAPATIHDLLERLERGVAKRQAAAAPEAAPDADEPQPGSLEETLGVLRRLASRVG